MVILRKIKENSLFDFLYVIVQLLSNIENKMYVLGDYV